MSVHRRWAPADLALVAEWWERGVKVEEIARRLGRTPSSVNKAARVTGARRPEWFVDQARMMGAQKTAAHAAASRASAPKKPHHPAMARFGAILTAAIGALDQTGAPVTGAAARRVHGRAVEEAIKIARGDHGVEGGVERGWAV